MYLKLVIAKPRQHCFLGCYCTSVVQQPMGIPTGLPARQGPLGTPELHRGKQLSIHNFQSQVDTSRPVSTAARYASTATAYAPSTSARTSEIRHLERRTTSTKTAHCNPHRRRRNHYSRRYSHWRGRQVSATSRSKADGQAKHRGAYYRADRLA